MKTIKLLYKRIKQANSLNYFPLQTWGIVTGATGDLGREYCKLLTHKGVNLIIVGRDLHLLKELSAELKEKAIVEVDEVCVDYTKSTNDIMLAYKNIVDERKEKLSILINCVGNGGRAYDFTESSISNIEEQLRVNVISHLITTNLFINSADRSEQRKLIVNISSFLGIIESPGLSLYSTSKSFMINFFKAIGNEQTTKDKNIDIVTLTPWYINTKMVKRIKVFFKQNTEDYARESLNISLNPFGSLWSKCSLNYVKFIIRGNRNEQHMGSKLHSLVYSISFLPKDIVQRRLYKFIMQYKIPSISDLRKQKKKE